MRFTKHLQDQVILAIDGVEQITDAEVVCVLAPRSDDYSYIPALWAALLALLSPLPLAFTHFWGHISTVLLLQLGVFVVVLLLCRYPPILRRIIPKNIRYWRAANMARRQFLENGLHHTREGSGVLIFVSAQECYVEILTDRGVSEKVADAQWQDIVSVFVERIKASLVADGFLECIKSCGKVLAEHYPATTDKNELPNKLVVLPD
jgi:putative membrane protein